MMGLGHLLLPDFLFFLSMDLATSVSNVGCQISMHIIKKQLSTT